MGKKFEVGSIIFETKEIPTYQSRDTLTVYYWHSHPRFQFLKTAAENSLFLDVGASTGGLSFWKEWSFPDRLDITMFAIDLQEGFHFNRYKDFQICNLDTDNIKFEDNFFDNVLMSHVLEHIENSNHVLTEIYRVLKPGGKAYFELPSLETLKYPSQKEFIKQGLDVITINFMDDATHIKTYALDELSKLMQNNGFSVIQTGKIQNNYLENELFTYGVNNNDQEILSYGVWSMLRWAQYIIVEKPIDNRKLNRQSDVID